MVARTAATGNGAPVADRPLGGTGPSRAALRLSPLWFGLFCLLALAEAAAAQQRASGADDDDPAPLSVAAIHALLRELDAHFVRGDVDAQLAAFAPDHLGAHLMFGLHLQQLCSRSQQRQRQSKIVGEPRLVGARTVVLVQHRMRWPDLFDADARRPHAADAECVEHCVYALRRGPSGAAVPTLAIEVPNGARCIESGTLRCPPCNYEIGGVDGWLCVPVRAERSQALEAATFHLLGTGIACDVSVQVAAQPVPAMVVAARLGDALRGLERTASCGPATAWLPPSLATGPGGRAHPEHLDGARLEVDLPDDQQQDGGGRALFHVVVFGGLQHVLLLRGSREALRRHQPEVDALLASYRLLESDCDLVLATSRPLQHHTGGRLDGGTYRNERNGVELAGPAGWQAQLRSGGAAFRVVWISPSGSHLWLTGHPVPLGMRIWCRTTADRWLRHLCERRQLDLEPAAAFGQKDEPSTGAGADGAGDWRECEGGGAARTLLAAPRAGAVSALPQRRWLHVQLHDDLLLVAEGFGTTEIDERAMRAAIRTLQRH